jgi:gluconokinase
MPQVPSTTSPAPPTLIVMGVCGCGKSLIGQALAQQLGGTFDDGDDFHPPANKAKMSAGIPLTDEDRWPWYAALRQRILDLRGGTSAHVIACSALKASYRQRLRGEDEPAQIAFLHLHGSRELIATRMAARKGHFMPPALLESQLATLEQTPDLITISIEPAPEAILANILTQLNR